MFSTIFSLIMREIMRNALLENDLKTVLSVRPGACRSSGRYSLANRWLIPAFSTRGKGALWPFLSAPAGASKRETLTSNLTESTALRAIYNYPMAKVMCTSSVLKLYNKDYIESQFDITVIFSDTVQTV